MPNFSFNFTCMCWIGVYALLTVCKSQSKQFNIQLNNHLLSSMCTTQSNKSYSWWHMQSLHHSLYFSAKMRVTGMPVDITRGKLQGVEIWFRKYQQRTKVLSFCSAPHIWGTQHTPTSSKGSFRGGLGGKEERKSIVWKQKSKNCDICAKSPSLWEPGYKEYQYCKKVSFHTWHFPVKFPSISLHPSMRPPSLRIPYKESSLWYELETCSTYWI